MQLLNAEAEGCNLLQLVSGQFQSRHLACTPRFDSLLQGLQFDKAIMRLSMLWTGKNISSGY